MATKIALLCLALLAVARALPIDHFEPLDETVDTVETVDDNQAASDLDAAVNLQVKARQRARNRQRARCCHVHHRHSPHGHIPHVHVTTDKLDDAGREIKKGIEKAGGELLKVIKMFEGMFGKTFQLPMLSIGNDIAKGFECAVNKIKAPVLRKIQEQEIVKNLSRRRRWAIRRRRYGRRLLTDVKSETGVVLDGAYQSVKTGAFTPILEEFCKIVRVFSDPIVHMFNGVISFFKNLFPSWLKTIMEWGGLKDLGNWLFKAFTIGAGFSIDYNIGGVNSVQAFEAGFSISVDNWATLQVGKTGCYLAGASGLTVPGAGSSEMGMQLTAFKTEGNIAGETTTAGFELDICKLLQLQCSVKLGAAVIFDNGAGKAEKLWKDCKSMLIGSEEALQLGDRTHLIASIQAMTKAEMKENVLEAATKFFDRGFKDIASCFNTLSDTILGIQLEGECGVSGVPIPVTGEFTFDFTAATSEYAIGAKETAANAKKAACSRR